jgi:hypothetical protein
MGAMLKQGRERKRHMSMGEQDEMSVVLLHVIMIEKMILKHNVFILLFLEILISESMHLM